MKYKITLSNQINALSFGIFFFIFFICCGFYYAYVEVPKQNVWGFTSILIVVSFLPVLYLHIEYYYYNKGMEIDIEPLENKLVCSNEAGQIKTIYFNELSKIVLYMDPTWHRKTSYRTLPFGVYHFAKILLKSGEDIIVTSLLIPRIEDALSVIKEVPMEKKVNFYPSILLQKKWQKF